MSRPGTRQVSRALRLACLLCPATVILLATSALAQEQERTWPLLVCAEPDNLPYSNEAAEGFENEIVAILADELGARVEYVWLPRPRLEGSEELMLRRGDCDLLPAVPDGTDPYLTTLAYYRSSAMFVLAEDAPFEIESLDDPDLRQLTIGVQRGSPEDFALTGRGFIGNVRHYHPNDPPAAILEAVADGSVDVGIVWGPIAGYHTRRLELPLVLEPVTPQFSSGFVSMIQATSMAVRANDRALQDLLNRAIASRWNEIQAVLAQWNVPIVPLPQPTLPGPEAGEAERLEIGVVLPALSGVDPLQPLGPELAAEPAWHGAVLAEEQLGGGTTGPFELRLASAPTVEAAERAARRLLLSDGATALIGGLGAAQAGRLTEVSDELGGVFVNIGAPEQALRVERCSPLGFHVEGSDEMYLSAIVALLDAEGVNAPYVVYADDERGRALHELFRPQLETAAGTAPVGSEAVPIQQPLYLQTFGRIEESGADSVVLLLPAGPQLVFLGQYESAGLEALVTGFPADVTQTRQFYAALAQDAPVTGTGARVALWESSLEGAAAELSENYLARWGRPMDSSAWAGYAAVKLLVEAFEAAGSAEPRALARQLLDPGFAPELGKEGVLGFDPGTHQLLQPLYRVRLDPGAANLGNLASPVATFEAFAPSEGGGCAVP